MVSVAQAAAFMGVVSGFWRIWWAAGVAMLVSGMIAVGMYSAGFSRVELSTESDESAKQAPESAA